MFDHEPFHEALKRFFPRMNAEAPTGKSFRKLLARACLLLHSGTPRDSAYPYFPE
jgi:hypothetical protein